MNNGHEGPPGKVTRAVIRNGGICLPEKVTPTLTVDRAMGPCQTRLMSDFGHRTKITDAWFNNQILLPERFPKQCVYILPKGTVVFFGDETVLRKYHCPRITIFVLNLTREGKHIYLFMCIVGWREVRVSRTVFLRKIIYSITNPINSHSKLLGRCVLRVYVFNAATYFFFLK